MNASSVTSLPTSAVPPVVRPEIRGLLEQVVACSRDEQRLLLERLLRELFGDNPEGESTVYDSPGKPYLHLLSPQARARLFITPERLALWESQDPEKDRPHSEIVALLQRGDENEIKAWLAARNA